MKNSIFQFTSSMQRRLPAASLRQRAFDAAIVVGFAALIVVGGAGCSGGGGGSSSQPQPVVWYRFENGTAGAAAIGTGTVLDSSGNGLNGTPYLSPVYRAVSEPNTKIGLQFTGGSQRVFVPDDSRLELTKSMTLEALVRFDGTADSNTSLSQIVFRGDDRIGLDPYYLSIDTNNKLNFTIEDNNGNGTTLVSPNSVPIGQFISVAGTLDDSTGLMSIYINGALVASTTTNYRFLSTLDADYTPGLGIGNVQSANYEEGFNGIIDEVRISNVALKPNQFLYPAGSL